MDFSKALENIKSGLAMKRTGWNGKGMYIFLVSGIYPDGAETNYPARIDMRTADGYVIPWLASQADILADDWQLEPPDDSA